MRKKVILIATILVLACGLLIGTAPDTLSMIFIFFMTALIGAGFIMGLLPIMTFENAFKVARDNIEQALDVQSTTSWLVVQRMDPFFRCRPLDKLFVDYKNKVIAQEKKGEIVCDIEDVISVDAISLRTWQGLLAQIPGTLTGLGLLGTFVGLIIGISSIGLSSVEAALESVETLLGGIQLAFYSSIAGVILSIIFNISNRIVWNIMLREYGLFIEDFHKQVIPSIEDQKMYKQERDMKLILERLDRIPKDGNFGMAKGGLANVSPVNEQILMPQIREGLKNGEFTFFLQPKIDLNSRKIVGAEALARWNHSKLGTLAPAVFMPVLEQNGYITKMDKFIWEKVCITIRNWIDAGVRPVPIALNISKTDLLAMDVCEFFDEMIQKYKIPPRCLELEISRSAYINNADAVLDVEANLVQKGFTVIIDAFDGDYMQLNMLEDITADTAKLDLRYLAAKDDDVLIDIFEQARKMRLNLQVMGIENTEQVSKLKRLGCQRGQGYYYFKPMEIWEFENITR